METVLLAVLVVLAVIIGIAALVAIFGLTRMLSGIQVEMRSVAERVSHVEQGQGAVDQSVQGLRSGLDKTGMAADQLVEATASIRRELGQASVGLAELKSHANARQDLEKRTADSIQRLEAVMAGTQSRGAAGENILEVLFSKLPTEWQVRDFRVGNKVVEFGLKLPNNQILPIDSKWAAVDLLQRFVQSDDPDEEIRLKSQIEATVLSKAREVRKYIDPGLTVGYGVAVVPDAVFDLCTGIQADVFQQNVVLVSYSMFVPYLLMVFQTVLKSSQNIDLDRLDAYLRSAQDSAKALQEELEGRFARAIKMMSNSRDDMSVHLGRVNSGLTSLQIGAGQPEPPAALLGPAPAEEPPG